MQLHNSIKIQKLSDSQRQLLQYSRDKVYNILEGIHLRYEPNYKHTFAPYSEWMWDDKQFVSDLAKLFGYDKDIRRTEGFVQNIVSFFGKVDHTYDSWTQLSWNILEIYDLACQCTDGWSDFNAKEQSIIQQSYRTYRGMIKTKKYGSIPLEHWVLQQRTKDVIRWNCMNHYLSHEINPMQQWTDLRETYSNELFETVA